MKTQLFLRLAFIPALTIFISCGNDKVDADTKRDAADTSINPISVPDTTRIVPATLSLPGSVRSVEDYFLMMPVQYVLPAKIDGDLEENEKKSMITKKDNANGYLRVEGGPYKWEGYSEIGLWKKPGGGDLVGVSVMEELSEAAPYQMIVFWEYKNEEWVDVTQSVFAPLTAQQVEKIYARKIGGDSKNALTGSTHSKVQIPEKGTTMEVLFEDNKSGEKKKVAEYVYADGKFTLKY
jgi:hypothetical protein